MSVYLAASGAVLVRFHPRDGDVLQTRRVREFSISRRIRGSGKYMYYTVVTYDKY